MIVVFVPEDDNIDNFAVYYNLLGFEFDANKKEAFLLNCNNEKRETIRIRIIAEDPESDKTGKYLCVNLNEKFNKKTYNTW